VRNKTFAGNVPAYIAMMNSMEGVGASKIDSLYEGEGIKALIMSAAFNKASDELLRYVQDQIDPETDVNNWGEEYGLPTLTSYKGKGYGMAPIDHSVLVFSVREKQINISVQLVYQNENYNWEILKSQVENVIEGYLLKLRKSWQKTAYITVRANHIGSELLQITGVEDANVSIEGQNTVTLAFDEIPTQGAIVNV
jgi:hypothetical protein